MWRIGAAVLFASVLVINGFAQALDQQDALTGFSKSPSEHIINQIDKPFVVRAIQGWIQSQGGDWPEGVRVIFEIRGPGNQLTIRRTYADRRGHFRVKGVAAGRYAFKATADGWQSVIGTIVVSKEAAREESIKIVMALGV